MNEVTEDLSGTRRPGNARSQRRLLAAIPIAFLLVMAFVGTALGHHTLPSASFACDGTVTWHVDTWTQDNANNQALASDVEVYYSLDEGPYVKIGDFAFTADNYLTGIGGTFDAGDATSVVIKAQLADGTGWGDGDKSSTGPWYSDSIPRSDEDCAKPTPTPVAPTPTPVATPTATPGGTGGVEAATGKPKVTPPSTSTSGPENGTSDPGFAIIIAGLIGASLSILLLTPRRKAVRAGKPERKE